MDVFEVTTDGRGIRLSGWKATAAGVVVIVLGLWFIVAAIVGSVTMVQWMTP